MSKTVFVGLSGGVDSAVSAALLREQGYNVVGAFIKIWSPEFIECTWKEDRLDAMRVCAALQIPVKEVDLSWEYKNEVIADMVSNYSRGVTPNPDVLCNRSIKFGHFSRWAFDNGADVVATGHYARIKKRSDGFGLFRGLDPNKDQSYFLYQLTQTDLSRTLFPIGGYAKPQVRALAKKFGLPNAGRPDSQGLCFVGDVTMKEFLSRFISLQPGSVIDEASNAIGTHDGAALYTLGERHGFSVSGSEVHYIAGIDIENNIVRVSRTKANVAVSEISLRDITWTRVESTLPLRIQAQARYREVPFAVELSAIPRSDLRTEDRTSVHAHFTEPHIAAPGQSLVLYREDECMGGGIINSLR